MSINEDFPSFNRIASQGEVIHLSYNRNSELSRSVATAATKAFQKYVKRNRRD